MTTFFSTFFRDALFATPTLLDSASVGIRLFRSAPSFSPNDSRYSGITTASGLTGLPGWSEVVAPGYPLSSTAGVSKRVNPPGSTNNYILLSLFPFTGLGSSVEVKAVAYYYVGTISGTLNPLIMVTDTPFLGERMVISGTDALTSNPDTSMAGANRWLFSWATPPGGAPSSALAQNEGPLAVLRGAPAFETSHTQHIWLYPQRANLIANPSFEKDAAFWVSNVSINRVAGAALGMGSWSGQFRTSAASSVRLNGSSGTWIDGPDLAALAGTTTLTLEIDCSLDDWTPASSSALVSQYASATTGAFLYPVGTSGALNLWVSDGSPSQITYLSGIAAFTDGTRHVVGGTWTAGPSSMQHVRDGVNFGAPITAAPFPGGLRNSTSGIRIGAQNDGSMRMTGNIYGLRIYAGGTLIASPDFTHMLAGQTIVTDAQGNRWTLKAAATVANPNVGPVIIESNIFDTQFEERWTIQLMAKGVGNLKVGFVWWDGTYQETVVDWGEETWKLDATNYTRISAARTGYQTFQGMVRLECDGPLMTIDNVLVEKGYLKDWPYFDGNTTYGARDDFSWYGNAPDASYSLWYNNKRATYGRLFARDIDGVAVVTDEVMAEQGYVYQWVPAGTTVQPHIDVFYPHDLQMPPANRSGVILPYKVSPTDLQGVANPW